MRVSVFGLGYVGCVTAACLSSRGHAVLGVDVNPGKVETINRGRSPIVETGLDGLIRLGRLNGCLQATTLAVEAVEHGDVLLICVGTPSAPGGNLNYTYLERVCSEIAGPLREIEDYKAIAFRSTLLPGALETRLMPLLAGTYGRQPGLDFGLAVLPEFLREGSAVHDFNHPPFTLIGAFDERAGGLLEELFADPLTPAIHTDPDTACLVKYACNAFHALKVAFANEIGLLCRRSGVDGDRVMEIFCEDRKLNLSPRYLKPGFAFGGSCLPKDLRALQYHTRHKDLHLPLLESILASNDLHIRNTIERILESPGRNVGIVGLTFKPGTDDLRESPLVALAEALVGKGLQVRIFDDDVNLSRLVGGNKAYIESVIPHLSRLMSPSLEDLIRVSDVIVIARRLDGDFPRLFKGLRQGQRVLDLVKIPDLNDGFLPSYEGICW
jgi:GDP-mannose 6-dehydrogenase